MCYEKIGNRTDYEILDRDALKREIAERVLNLRKEEKLSQFDVSIEADVDRRSIARYENGESEIPGTVLAVYAKLFNKSVDYLVFGEKSEVILKKQLADFLDNN